MYMLWVGSLTGKDGEEKEIVRERDESIVTKIGKHTVGTHWHLQALLYPILQSYVRTCDMTGRK